MGGFEGREVGDFAVGTDDGSRDGRLEGYSDGSSAGASVARIVVEFEGEGAGDCPCRDGPLVGASAISITSMARDTGRERDRISPVTDSRFELTYYQ